MSVHPLPQGLEFRRRPTTFKLGSVLALLVQLEIKSILKVSEFSLIDRRTRQGCGDKDDSILFGQDQVPRQHYGPSDADRNVDPRQLHLRPCRWIVPAIESVEIRYGAVLLRVPDAGVEDESRMGVGGDAASQVGADQRALNDLSIAVGNHRVSHLEFIDHPTVGPADATLGLTLCSNSRGHVGPPGHELRCESTAGKGLFDMEGLPATLELVGVALAAQVVPHILDRHIQRALEQILRYFRSPVRKTLALPIRGVEHHLLPRLLDLSECR